MDIEALISGLKGVQSLLDEDGSHFAAVEGAIALLSGELPCSVRLPPATTIAAGCSLSTLIVALHMPGREGLSFRDLSIRGGK